MDTFIYVRIITVMREHVKEPKLNDLVMMKNVAEESAQKRFFGCGFFKVEQADLIQDCKEASGYSICMCTKRMKLVVQGEKLFACLGDMWK